MSAAAHVSAILLMFVLVVGAFVSFLPFRYWKLHAAADVMIVVACWAFLGSCIVTAACAIFGVKP